MVTKNTNILPTHATDTEQLNGTEEQDYVTTKPGGDQLEGEWHIKLFRVRFTTRRLNPMFERLAKLCPTFWHWWFSLGVVVGGLMMIVNILVLVGAAFKTLTMLGSLLHASLSATNDINDQQMQQWTKRYIEHEDMEHQNEHIFLSMVT